MELLNRIEKRTKQMFKEGAIKEVKKYNNIKLNQYSSSKKVIGINEITKYLIKESSLAETRDIISIKTRQYAKRQVTWARGQMKSWSKIEPKSINSFLKKV